MAKRMTTEEFIKRAKEIHGDKYDYSNVEYKNIFTKVKIKCNQCNSFFLQIPHNHLRGRGCPECGKIKAGKLTTEEFIEKAKEVHGDKYDYSEVKYKNNYTKVKIICPIHGEFYQIPFVHLEGCGCPECGLERIRQISNDAKLTTKEFIEKARKVHGDKYDYSEVKYKNSRTRVKIICPKHGEFYQTPHSHLSGCGCPKCAGNKKLTTEEFIKRAKEVHGDKYDYSEVRYINNKTKVKIICPIHGEFYQIPSSHLSGYGCPKCGNSARLTTKEFIEKAKMVHRDRYDYSKIKYKNAFTKVKIICPIHGEFYQIPNNHLNGQGCPKCGLERIRLTTEEFIEKAKEVHGDKYDYSNVEYKNIRTKVKIKCNQCNNFFWQVPYVHLKGHGCPKCADPSFDFDKPAILYYVKVHHGNKTYYKVGITNKTVETRFCSEDLQKMEVIKIWEFERGEDAYEKEQEILEKYEEYRYDGDEKILESGGNTELFTKDILNLEGLSDG